LQRSYRTETDKTQTVRPEFHPRQRPRLTADLVLIEQEPDTLTAPVVVKAKLELVIDAEVIASVLTDTAASRVTPAVFVTDRGTLSRVAGVQLIIPDPANWSCTLPEPVPVLNEAAADGLIRTVPAEEPLSGPVLIEPPAVTRSNTTEALVTVLARVMAPDLTHEEGRRVQRVSPVRKQKEDRRNRA
jgi:hypothetical protein